MSIPFSSERLAGIRDDVRRLAGRAGEHEDDLEGLVLAAEDSVRDAEAALSRARAPTGSAWIEQQQQHQQLCRIRLERNVEIAEALRRVCVRVREQHVTAVRLLTRLDDESAEQQENTSARRLVSVLVVDDVEDIRELVADTLCQGGFVVRTAVNGLDALIAAYEMQPSVIVMDVVMPVLDGIEATRLIKAVQATRHARVIAYTANPSLADVFVDRLFLTVLSKSSTPDMVLAAVQNAAGL